MADYEKQLKKLLSNKKSMGGDKYAAAIGKLKKDMKANNAGSFKKLLNNVKKQEREGQFDRGAEGKAKNNLRKKMASKAEKSFTAGRHKGSDVDKEIEKGMKGATSEEEVRVAQRLTGTKEKKKKESIAKSR